MAKKKVGLSKLFQTAFFFTIIKRIPLSLLRYFFLVVGKIYHSFNSNERRKYLTNIVHFSKSLQKGDAYKLYFKAREGLYEHYMEKMFVATRPLDEVMRSIVTRSHFKDPHLLDNALAEGRGVILVTAHWGAVEYIPALLNAKGYPLSIILETSTSRLAQILQNNAVNTNIELIIESAGASVLEESLKALKRGRILMTQVDEVDAWRRRKKNTIHLFNQELYFDHMLDFLHRKSGGSPAIGIYAKRLGKQKYEMITETIEMDSVEHPQVARKSLLQWENYVIQHPEQWYQWKKWDDMVV